MIKAYLTGIPSLYEGEDIEVRYCIFEDEVLLSKETIMIAYEKPALVGQVSLLILLEKLQPYLGKEINIIVNDTTLHEIIKGTSRTKNQEVTTMAIETREQLSKLNHPTILDVSGDHKQLVIWHENLKP
ncbi:MAG: hypothetical protein H7Y41_05925 [Hyphomonadaceae bacterium]|nr:hypothetical protein [Clostridia bacterium]